ncbi:MAG: ANTAR domain-containing protein [Clostridia bacterium]|nr:ANTAR domain-containing protein [Clostridia bacterium]
MDLGQRVYSVLIVSSSASFNSALSGMLPLSRFDPIVNVCDVSAAKRSFYERQFDFVIINSPVADNSGIRLAIDIGANSKTSVVLFIVRSELYDETYAKMTDQGVFTLAKPLSKQVLATALSWMICERERLRGFEEKTVSIEEKMEEIRLVNRAKWLLIRELKMEEPDAHRYIEKQAMDRCISKKEIAMEIISTYS